jgi:divalent metal cation (Fe/Co/Zn/Cd) transporter
MSISDAHLITDRIEARIKEQWPRAVVTIHTDPGHMPAPENR